MEGRTRGKVGGRNVHRKLPETGWHHRARGWHSGLLHRDAGVGGVTEDRMMAAMKLTLSHSHLEQAKAMRDRAAPRTLSRDARSAERRVGQACVLTCRSRWAQYH